MAATTDRRFAWLMLFQWLAGIAASIWDLASRRAGSRARSTSTCNDGRAARGVISIFPVILPATRAGTVDAPLDRRGQMLTRRCSSISRAGGSRRTFHVFGSLALLGSTADTPVADHRSIVVGGRPRAPGLSSLSPVYGVLTASPWRALEHPAGSCSRTRS